MTPELQPTEYEDRVKEGQRYLVVNHDYLFVLCWRSNDFNIDKRISITKSQLITNFTRKMKKKKWRCVNHEDPLQANY